jgi:hypothetical protein
MYIYICIIYIYIYMGLYVSFICTNRIDVRAALDVICLTKQHLNYHLVIVIVAIVVIVAVVIIVAVVVIVAVFHRPITRIYTSSDSFINIIVDFSTINVTIIVR